MRRVVIAVVAAAVVFGAVSRAQAGFGRWGPSNGPEGAPFSVTALIIDPQNPQTLYVGTFMDGIFKSTNGGRSWQPANAALTGSEIDELVLDPHNSQVLYAVTTSDTDTSHLFKSSDGARRWQQVARLGHHCCSGLAVDPQNSGTLYAGGDGVLKSTDGGRTWRPVSTDWAVEDVAIDPQNSHVVYAASSQGVFKSVDGGENWRAANAGLSDRFVSVLAIDTQNPLSLYAGTVGKGLFKSSDGGKKWQPANQGLTASFVTAIGVDPRSSQTIYAGTHLSGVFKSTDGGASWRGVAGAASVGADVEAFVFDTNKPNTLYTATYESGPFRSDDAGQDWMAAHEGLTDRSVQAVAIDPKRHRIVYAGSQIGVFKSGDGAASWGILAAGPNSAVNALAVDPDKPETVYAAGDHGVFKSANSGKTWRAENIGLAVTDVLALAIDPVNPETLYVGTSGSGTAVKGGLFKSTDGARNWRSVGPKGGYVSSIAVDSVNPNNVYASTGDGILKSSNSGRTWVTVQGSLDGVLAVDPTRSQIVYAGDEAHGVYKSTNAGKTWQASSVGLTNRHIRALVIDPHDSETIYVACAVASGSRSHRVFRSTNGGRRWQPFDAGLTATDVQALAIDKSGRFLYAGTDGNGVLDLRLRR